MGLLDDAIREHLELKRLKGDDPGEVARAEQDALGPVYREDGSGPNEQVAGRADDPPNTDGPSFSESEPVSDISTATINHVNQETIEINMEVELERGANVEDGDGASNDARVTPAGHPTHIHADRDESREWEMSSDRSGERGEITTPESDIESRSPHHSATDGHVEDTLDEIPGFALDTPEQKRSWFRRRPRRALNE